MELGQGPPDTFLSFRPEHVVDRALDRARGALQHRMAADVALGPQLVERPVAGDHRQPRADGPTAIGRVRRGECPDVGVLHQVVHLRRVLDDPEADGPDLLAVLPELLEADRLVGLHRAVGRRSDSHVPPS
jgi:hypothetical protein